MTTRPRPVPKLPVKQLTILAICRFAEPISITSLLPYLPSMVRSFDVDEQDVGKWAGLCSSMFSICQAIVGIPWGRFSDIYGRKISILMGLTSTMITTMAWGFSRSLSFAIVVRAISGAGNGNVGIIRTTVAEMVPFKELQPLAFSIMPLVWNIGSVLGPALGGSLANPLNVKPGQTFQHPSFLQQFPYALPNILAACFFFVGIVVGFLFLEETLETLRGRRDFGLRMGDKIIASVKHVKRQMKRPEIDRLYDTSHADEPLIKANEREYIQPSFTSPQPRPPPPSFREVLNKQAVMNLITYTLLAMHSMAFDQLLPVYLQYPSVYSGDSVVTRPFLDSNNPFKFAGGVGLDHFTIGLISTGYGIFGMLVQFFVYPTVARRYGVLNCLKICSYVFPLAWFLMPLTALIPSQSLQIVACFAVLLIKCSCAIFAFPCSTILLTNSASGSRTLGTLNGFATSTSAIGRAAGPALGGIVFSYGVRHGYVIMPWWTLMVVSIIAAVPVFWLIEGEGFGDDEEVSDESEICDDESHADTAVDETLAFADSTLHPETTLGPTHGGGDATKSSLSPLTSASSAVAIDDSESDCVSPRPSDDGGSLRTRSARGLRAETTHARVEENMSRTLSGNSAHSFGSFGSYAGRPK